MTVLGYVVGVAIILVVVLLWIAVHLKPTIQPAKNLKAKFIKHIS